MRSYTATHGHDFPSELLVCCIPSFSSSLLGSLGFGVFLTMLKLSIWSRSIIVFHLALNSPINVVGDHKSLQCFFRFVRCFKHHETHPEPTVILSVQHFQFSY